MTIRVCETVEKLSEVKKKGSMGVLHKVFLCVFPADFAMRVTRTPVTTTGTVTTDSKTGFTLSSHP